MPNTMFNSYNIINISGNFVYIEGHNGLKKLSESEIIFKTNKGDVLFKGNGMFLKELSKNIAVIQGKIYKTEVF